jgi:hypothetical protein
MHDSGADIPPVLFPITGMTFFFTGILFLRFGALPGLISHI